MSICQVIANSGYLGTTITLFKNKSYKLLNVYTYILQYFVFPYVPMPSSHVCSPDMYIKTNQYLFFDIDIFFHTFPKLGVKKFYIFFIIFWHTDAPKHQLTERQEPLKNPPSKPALLTSMSLNTAFKQYILIIIYR